MEDDANKYDTLWVVSELYYPEETSTGFILTKIAEGLAASMPVRVVCGQPTYSARGKQAPIRETRKGVKIRRCWGTTWNKDAFLLRIINMLTISWSIWWHLLCNVRRHQRVLVVTNPPLLPFAVSWACRLRRAKCVLLIHDVYPDVALATGWLRPNAVGTRMLDWLVKRLYRSVEQIIVLGRDMKERVRAKVRTNDDKIEIITNWADIDLVHPQPRSENPLLKELGLEDKFIVQYAGNLGRSHNVEAVADCAIRMRSASDVHFLVIGSGAKKSWLEGVVRTEQLENVTIIGHRPRSEQPIFLNACNVSLITFVRGMSGVSVPSRMYNVLAAGTPIIAVADADSELAQVVHEEQVGWVVSSEDRDELVSAVQQARNHTHELECMGTRARQAAESKYRLQDIVNHFEKTIISRDRSESGLGKQRAA